MVNVGQNMVFTTIFLSLNPVLKVETFEAVSCRSNPSISDSSVYSINCDEVIGKNISCCLIDMVDSKPIFALGLFCGNYTSQQQNFITVEGFNQRPDGTGFNPLKQKCNVKLKTSQGKPQIFFLVQNHPGFFSTALALQNDTYFHSKQQFE